MDNSLRDAMMQMVSLQAQSLNAINQLTSTVQMNGASSSLPPASALTSYTNYAAPYQGPTNPFAPSPQAQARFQSYASQIAPNGLADAVKQYVNTPAGQVSPEQRQLMGANLGASLTNTAIAGTGAAAGGIGSAIGYALMPGFLPSIAAGGLAGLGAGAITSVALDQAQQSQAINKFLLQNSYRFINPMESVNDRGIAGFSQSQRWQAASFLRNFDVKANIRDDQTMQLLQGFTEGGLLKSTSDLKTFETKFTQLAGYVKQAAITLNTSFKQTTDLMADLEKRGLLSQNFDYFAAGAKTMGMYTGQAPLEATQSAANIAAAMTGTNSTASFEVSAANAARYGAIIGKAEETAKNLRSTNPAQARYFDAIKNLGNGDSAAAMQSLINVTGNMYDSDSTLAILYAGLSLDSSGQVASSERWLKEISKYSDMKEAQRVAMQNLDDLKGRTGLNWDQAVANARGSYLENSLLNSRPYIQLYDPSISLRDIINRYGFGFNDTQSEVYQAVMEAATPEFLAGYDITTKKNQELAARNAKLVGVGGVFRNLGASFGNALGGLIAQPLTQSATQTAQTIADIWNGGAVLNPSYSNASYKTNDIIKLTSQAEGEARGAGLLNPTPVQTSQGTYMVSDNTVAGVQKRIANAMEGMIPGTEEYKKYEDILKSYKDIEAAAEGFSQAGKIISPGYTRFDYLYGNMDWSGKTPGGIQIAEKTGLKILARDLSKIAGSEEAINKYLDEENIIGLTGRSRAFWQTALASKDPDKVLAAVEQMMTDLQSTKSNDPNQQPTAQNSTGNADMIANTVNLYVGTVVDNRPGQMTGMFGNSYPVGGVGPVYTPKSP